MRVWLCRFLLGISILWPFFACRGQEVATQEKPSAEAAPETPTPEAPADDKRTELNLIGKTEVQAGESRRNENVQFNLIDNNALKELNVRLGSSATVTRVFQPEFRYFGTEFGNKPSGPMHLGPASRSRDFYGGISFTHSNSIFSARSFFQAGSVKPAHENNYGFVAGIGLWRGAHLTVGGSGQKTRGRRDRKVVGAPPPPRVAPHPQPSGLRPD